MQVLSCTQRPTAMTAYVEYLHWAKNWLGGSPGAESPCRAGCTVFHSAISQPGTVSSSKAGVLCASPCTFPKRTIPILIKALKREGSNALCSSLLLSIYMSYMLSMYLNMFKSLPPTLNTNQPTKKSHHLVNTAETWQEVSNYNCVCTGHLTVHFNSLQIKGKKIMLLTCSFQAVKVKSIHHLEQTVCYPTPH